VSNQVARKLIELLEQLGYRDIRVNQQQLAAILRRVGINRPDIQATSPEGLRVLIEIEAAASERGLPHALRSLANDTGALIIVIKLFR
jgi:hypothetical protein